jgi:2-polyprenyl-6-methoxyphenol hydroxylase-like FAD-dependent oxidoreductase
MTYKTCCVKDVIKENGIVRVPLEDSTEEVSDLVVGADSVYSSARELM